MAPCFTLIHGKEIIKIKGQVAQGVNNRLYYGWVMLAVGMAGNFFSGPGQTYTISLFIDPLVAEFGLSRTAISSAYGTGTMIGALGLFHLGSLIDRHGARLVLAIAALMLGVTCLLFPFAGGLVAFYFLFTSQRFFGQGSIPLACNNLVSQWFLSRRGLALSLLGVGSSLGYAVFPPVVQKLIGLWGWQWAFVSLGLSVIVVLLPLVLLLVVNKPEDMGLTPEGSRPLSTIVNPTQSTPVVVAPETNWTRGEALRTRQFWILSLGKATHGALITGLTFHQISLMAEQGINANVAAMALTVAALARLVAGLLMGPFLDRLSVHLVLSIGFAFMALGMAYLVTVDSMATAFLYAGIIGTSGGILMTGGAFAFPHYFGRSHLGSIQGPANTIGILGAALGPVPFGIAFDLLGGYHGAILIQAIIPVVLAVASLAMGSPRHRSA